MALPAPSPARHRPTLAPSLLALRWQPCPLLQAGGCCWGSHESSGVGAPWVVTALSPPAAQRPPAALGTPGPLSTPVPHCPEGLSAPPVPFNSNNGQASALLPARCLHIPPRLPVAHTGAPAPVRGAEQPLPCAQGSAPAGRYPLAQTPLCGAAPTLLAGAVGQCWCLRCPGSACTLPVLGRARRPCSPHAPAPRRALPPLGDNPFCSPPEPPPGTACPRCPFPAGWGPVPRAPSLSAAAHQGCGTGSCQPWPLRTELPAKGHRTIFL